MKACTRRKLRPRVAVTGSALLLATTALSACGPRQPWQNELVSVNAEGTDSGNHDSLQASFSPDGTKVVFSTRASDLGPTDTNGLEDVYLRDVESGTTTLVSANAAGTDSGNAISDFATFSPDGTKVAFRTEASDLGPIDTNRSGDVYVRDLESGTTTLVSVNADGSDSGNFTSGGAAFSPDGSKIAFGSFATDLGPTDTNSQQPPIGFPLPDVYVRDLTTGETTLVSVNRDGTDSSNAPSFSPLFSPDGTRIVFWSAADDLSPVETGGLPNVYVRDLVAGTTTLVSVDAGGTRGGNGESLGAGFSPDGKKIAFNSIAGDLVPGEVDTNGENDVYVRDIRSGTTRLVSARMDGTAAGSDRAGAFAPVLSPDGTTIAFTSRAGDLVPNDTNGVSDLFLRELASGRTTLVTANVDGAAATYVPGAFIPGVGYGFAFSPDGTRIAFAAAAEDLVPVETNLGFGDVYVRDLRHDTTTLVSSDAAGTSTGDGHSGVAGNDAEPRRVAFSPDGRRLLLTTQASNLGPNDSDRPDTGDPLRDFGNDIYMATLRGADLSIDGRARPDPVEPGDRVRFRFEVENGGPDAAEDATVAVLLPEGVGFRKVETTRGDCTEPTRESLRPVVCHLGDLPVDAAAKVTVTASVDAPPGRELVAVGTVSSEDTADPVHRNNTTRVSVSVSGG